MHEAFLSLYIFPTTSCIKDSGTEFQDIYLKILICREKNNNLINCYLNLFYGDCQNDMRTNRLYL